ncbi:MAG TPA: hypothetical protein VIM56_06210 [Rhizomicrobium sp.]
MSPKKTPKLTSGGVRAYARHRGLKSDNSVRKAIASGRIAFEGDGKTIDFAKADKAWDRNTDPAQQRKTSRARKPAAKAATDERSPPPERSAAKSKPSDPPADADQPVTQEQVDIASRYLSKAGKAPSGPGFTMVDARTAEIFQKMEERQINMDAKLARLIDKDKSLAKIFALARAERDSWLQWPTRMVSLMAADIRKAGGEVENQSLETILEHYVRKHLAKLAGVNIKLG